MEEKKKNEAVAVDEAVAAYEAVAVDEVDEVDEVKEPTPELEKARRILRARLPKLSEAGLNFEKRTGNFFKATLEKVTEKTQDVVGNEVDKLDNNGKPVYVIDPKTGTPVEKVRRTVVAIEDECGGLLPEYKHLAAEVAAKRAAAVIANSMSEYAKLRKAYEAATTALDNAAEALDIHAEQYNSAANDVMAFELPETTRATRMSVSSRLVAVEDENAKLRAKLIAAGIDPDKL